jgi:hypothetical protein
VPIFLSKLRLSDMKLLPACMTAHAAVLRHAFEHRVAQEDRHHLFAFLGRTHFSFFLNAVLEIAYDNHHVPVRIVVICSDDKESFMFTKLQLDDP